jgi:hypothetical protein
LFEHVQITDVVGEKEHEGGIQRCTLLLRQTAMGFHDLLIS